MSECKKFVALVKVGLVVGLVVLGLLMNSCFRRYEKTTERPVRVIEIKPSGQGIWSVQGDAIAKTSDLPFVTRLKYLRAERLKVTIVGQAGKDFLLRSDDLKADDLLVLTPETVMTGQAVVPIDGLTDGKVIGLVLEAGMAAAEAEDLDESVRFISPHYRDGLGFTISLIRQLLKRAYEEFDEPRIELSEPPTIQVKDSKAVVETKVSLSAVYRGRRNYLLGDQETPNRVLVGMNKSAYGWKVTWIEGLRPLGFEEQFLRLLGAEFGLTLTRDEQQKRQQACMPCRQRMAERFGPW